MPPLSEYGPWSEAGPRGLLSSPEPTVPRSSSEVATATTTTTNTSRRVDVESSSSSRTISTASTVATSQIASKERAVLVTTSLPLSRATTTASRVVNVKPEEPDVSDDSDSDSDDEDGADSDDDNDEDVTQAEEVKSEVSSTSNTISRTGIISGSGSGSATGRQAIQSSKRSITVAQSRTVSSHVSEATFMVTSADKVYPAIWTVTDTAYPQVSTLIAVGPVFSASLAQNNNAINDENIFHTHNKLFPLAIIAVIIASLFFLLTAGFFIIRLSGWNRKRKTRKLTPSFFSGARATMWEPKFNMLSSHPDNMASTTSYPIARTVNLEGQDSQASTDSRRLIWRSQGLATNAPGTYIPDDSGPRYVPEIQAYSGAFFPLPSQGGAQENPFIKPGEYASALRPEPSLGRTLLASSNTGSRSQASTVPSSNDSPGSPVPSFNTGRVLVQMETPGRQAASAPEHIGIPSRVASIPPPYITPVVGDHDLHDDYKFDNLERQPSNGSTLLSRTRWNSAANGPRSACVEPSSPGGSSTWQKMSREGAKPESVRQFKASEVSKSSRLAKQKVWASDRI